MRPHLGPSRTRRKDPIATVTMYSTEWCGHCRRLKSRLSEAGIPVEEIDVDFRDDLSREIIEATGGYRVVPTVRIGDRLLVNPSLEEIRSTLAES